MAWPKGKPRKGYVKADGTPHAKWGSKVNEPVERKPVVKTQKADKRIRMRKVSADVFNTDVNHPEVGSGYIHGATGTAITEPCPNCNFAYADGGYCPSCGWSLPINRIPYGGPK